MTWATRVGDDPGLIALLFAAYVLWYRGYPDQALERARHGLYRRPSLSHPLLLAAAMARVTDVYMSRREGHEAYAQMEALLPLAHEHGFAFWLGYGTSLQGWALVEQAAQSGAREQREAGIVQLQEGLAALQATGTEGWVPHISRRYWLRGYAQGGQAQEGLEVIVEALAASE